jgi:hypothetical protein
VVLNCQFRDHGRFPSSWDRDTVKRGSLVESLARLASPTPELLTCSRPTVGGGVGGGGGGGGDDGNGGRRRRVTTATVGGGGDVGDG